MKRVRSSCGFKVVGPLSWYFLFGILHELSHVVIAQLLLFLESPSASLQHRSAIRWIPLLFLRRFDFDSSLFDEQDVRRNAFLIRHFGWLASVAIAFVLPSRIQRLLAKVAATRKAIGVNEVNEVNEVEVNSDGPTPTRIFHWCHLAAYLTAMDAIWTDLLQWNPTFFVHSHDATSSTLTSSSTFFCGNFGVILLHAAWLSEHSSSGDNSGSHSKNDHDSGSQTTLNILRKMIQVTMMRGAQSGGIVTFERINAKNDHVTGGSEPTMITPMKSIRSRVVKSKRGDL